MMNDTYNPFDIALYEWCSQVISLAHNSSDPAWDRLKFTADAYGLASRIHLLRITQNHTYSQVFGILEGLKEYPCSKELIKLIESNYLD